MNTNHSSTSNEKENKENFKLVNNSLIDQNKIFNNSIDILIKNMNPYLEAIRENEKNNINNKIKTNIVNLNQEIKINSNFNNKYDKYVMQNDNNCLPISIKEKEINSFYSLGIYYMFDKNINNKYYFDVFFRKIRLNDDNFIEDIFFNDVTDLIKSKQIIIDENIKKQKLFAKFAHEFKTPLNSVIGIASEIKDSDKMLSNFTSIKLNTIQNLSNYLIFLVSDIIQYSKLNDISDINLNISTLDLSEILNFCFEILNSLLSLNNRKNENISSELIADKTIYLLNIESDEIRIKQIILNFISNSVKFTNEGSIIIKAKKTILDEKNFLKISVKDTGIGIKKKDKKSLFQECQALEYGKHLNRLKNSFGSGLGLSISNYPAYKFSTF